MNDKSRNAAPTLTSDQNFSEAEDFLMALDPTTNSFTFQTFDDAKERSDPRLARIIHGFFGDNLSDLTSLNARGGGVFVCINGTDLKGRGTCHITRVRAVWQDDDHGWQGKFPLTPSLVVSTSPGRLQRLWLCDDLTSEQHRAAQGRLAISYGHDRHASDLSRVLRLPGFRHMKNPDTPHIVRLIGGNRQRYSAAEILTAFPALEKPQAIPQRRCRPCTDDDHRIHDALRRIPADEREVWLRVGMALYDYYGNAGRAIWDEWSATSEKFDPKIQERIWRSLRCGGVGIGTIFYLAGTYTNVA